MYAHENITSPLHKKEETNSEPGGINFQEKSTEYGNANSMANMPSSETKNVEEKIKRRFPPNQFLKFSSLILVPGKPRKWRRVQRRAGRNEGAWLYKWECIPESIDNIFVENLDLMARGVVGPRRTGRTTRAVSFHMRETVLGSGNMYEIEHNFDQYGPSNASQTVIDQRM